MSDITIAAYATAKVSVRTVEDLRDLVGWLDKYRVPNDVQLDWDRDAVYVMLTNDKETSAVWIECGDHIPPESRYDLLLETHQHEERI